MGTILDRGYVYKKGTALVPTFVAFSVTQLLEQALRPARRLRLHREARGRPRPDRSRRRGAGRLAPPLLLRRRQRSGLHALVTDHLDGHRRARRQLDRDTRIRHRRARRALRAVPRARRATGEPSRRPRTRRAHAGAGRRATGPALRRRAHARRRIRRRAGTWRPRIGRYGPYVTEVLAEGEDGKPRTASLFASMSPRHDHARRRCSAPHAAANPRRARRARRSSSRTGATARSSSEEPRRARSSPRSSSSHSRSSRQRHSSPSRSNGGAEARRRRRSRRSDPIRRAGSRSWSRTVGSARTSRTARPTQVCGAETPLRGSRSSEPSSCSPKDALRARKASREGVFAVRPSGHDLTRPRPAASQVK